MREYVNVRPAYGRDYRSKKALLSDWDEGKDFIITNITHRDCGRYVNVTDLKREGHVIVNARYDKLRKVCVIEVTP